jgi:hypothetical protein
MGEDERPLDVEHVQLDQVAAELQGDGERLDRVLGRERGGAAMADPQHAA